MEKKDQLIEKFVNQDMDAEEMAYVIYYYMKVMASCKILGVEQHGNRWKPKGEIVCDLLWAYDRQFNVNVRGSNETRIKRKPPNSIGGYLADKIFRWKYEILEDDVKYTIWRIQ